MRGNMTSRQNNPGKREREARKRHRRALVSFYSEGSFSATLKLGREHSRRRICQHLHVADSRKVLLAKGVEESGRQHQTGQDRPGATIEQTDNHNRKEDAMRGMTAAVELSKAP